MFLKIPGFLLLLGNVRSVKGGVFFKKIGLNELKIRLADSTPAAITFAGITDFNVRQLGPFLKMFFLLFLHCFP